MTWNSGRQPKIKPCEVTGSHINGQLSETYNSITCWTVGYQTFWQHILGVKVLILWPWMSTWTECLATDSPLIALPMALYKYVYDYDYELWSVNICVKDIASTQSKPRLSTQRIQRCHFSKTNVRYKRLNRFHTCLGEIKNWSIHPSL